MKIHTYLITTDGSTLVYEKLKLLAINDEVSVVSPTLKIYSIKTTHSISEIEKLDGIVLIEEDNSGDHTVI